MRSAPRLFVLLCIAASCTGCAASILQSTPDAPKVIQAGATEVEIAKRFGSPVKSSRLESPSPAERIQQDDHQVSVLNANGLAVSKAVFGFKGRLDSKARAGKAGFDSFMTLGLAEIYLIPKALWERLVDEDLQLTVWFDAAGQAVAYRWNERTTN